MGIQDHKVILSALIRMGLPQTLKLVAVGLGLALAIGIVLGVIRSFRIPVLDQILGLYAQICRGVPVMIILLFAYAALPPWRRSYSRKAPISWKSSRAVFSP